MGRALWIQVTKIEKRALLPSRIKTVNRNGRLFRLDHN